MTLKGGNANALTLNQVPLQTQLKSECLLYDGVQDTISSVKSRKDIRSDLLQSFLTAAIENKGKMQLFKDQFQQELGFLPPDFKLIALQKLQNLLEEQDLDKTAFSPEGLLPDSIIEDSSALKYMSNHFITVYNLIEALFGKVIKSNIYAHKDDIHFLRDLINEIEDDLNDPWTNLMCPGKNSFREHIIQDNYGILTRKYSDDDKGLSKYMPSIIRILNLVARTNSGQAFMESHMPNRESWSELRGHDNMPFEPFFAMLLRIFDLKYYHYRWQDTINKIATTIKDRSAPFDTQIAITEELHEVMSHLKWAFEFFNLPVYGPTETNTSPDSKLLPYLNQIKIIISVYHSRYFEVGDTTVEHRESAKKYLKTLTLVPEHVRLSVHNFVKHLNKDYPDKKPFDIIKKIFRSNSSKTYPKAYLLTAFQLTAYQVFGEYTVRYFMSPMRFYPTETITQEERYRYLYTLHKIGNNRNGKSKYHFYQRLWTTAIASFYQNATKTHYPDYEVVSVWARVYDQLSYGTFEQAARALGYNPDILATNLNITFSTIEEHPSPLYCILSVKGIHEEDYFLVVISLLTLFSSKGFTLNDIKDPLRFDIEDNSSLRAHAAYDLHIPSAIRNILQKMIRTSNSKTFRDVIHMLYSTSYKMPLATTPQLFDLPPYKKLNKVRYSAGTYFCKTSATVLISSRRMRKIQKEINNLSRACPPSKEEIEHHVYNDPSVKALEFYILHGKDLPIDAPLATEEVTQERSIDEEEAQTQASHNSITNKNNENSDNSSDSSNTARGEIQDKEGQVDNRSTPSSSGDEKEETNAKEEPDYETNGTKNTEITGWHKRRCTENNRNNSTKVNNSKKSRHNEIDLTDCTVYVAAAVWIQEHMTIPILFLNVVTNTTTNTKTYYIDLELTRDTLEIGSHMLLETFVIASNVVNGEIPIHQDTVDMIQQPDNADPYRIDNFDVQVSQAFKDFLSEYTEVQTVIALFAFRMIHAARKAEDRAITIMVTLDQIICKIVSLYPVVAATSYDIETALRDQQFSLCRLFNVLSHDGSPITNFNRNQAVRESNDPRAYFTFKESLLLAPARHRLMPSNAENRTYRSLVQLTKGLYPVVVHMQGPTINKIVVGYFNFNVNNRFVQPAINNTFIIQQGLLSMVNDSRGNQIFVSTAPVYLAKFTAYSRLQRNKLRFPTFPDLFPNTQPKPKKLFMDIYINFTSQVTSYLRQSRHASYVSIPSRQLPRVESLALQLVRYVNRKAKDHELRKSDRLYTFRLCKNKFWIQNPEKDFRTESMLYKINFSSRFLHMCFRGPLHVTYSMIEPTMYDYDTIEEASNVSSDNESGLYPDTDSNITFSSGDENV